MSEHPETPTTQDETLQFANTDQTENPASDAPDVAAQIQDLNDQLLRAKAELENLRRRHAEELANARKFAMSGFATELLPVRDCLEMALADQSGQFETLKMGVDMTLKQLIAAFEHFNLQPISPLGEKLDPHKHQAMQTIESDQEPNTIVQVMQKGYMLSDRVLRPAMVIVAKEKSE